MEVGHEFVTSNNTQQGGHAYILGHPSAAAAADNQPL